MRKSVLIVILSSILFSVSCSSVAKTEDSDAIVSSSSASDFVMTDDSYYVDIVERDGHLTGESEKVTIDVDVDTNYPTTANIYKFTCYYPTIIMNGFVDCLQEYEGLHTWCWEGFAAGEGDNWNPNICHLFDTQVLGWSYKLSGVSEDELSFIDYVLSERDSIAIEPVDSLGRDLISALGLDESKYERVISCQHLSPSGGLYPKYNIMQSIDDIDVFEITVFPQFSSQLGIVRINGWFGIAQAVAVNANYNTIVIGFVNEDNANCTIDTLEYEMLDVMEEDVDIMPLKDVIGSYFYSHPSSESSHIYIYMADLVYMPLTLIDEDTGEFTGESYLYPCWVLFYTGTATGGDLEYEIDGVMAFDAVTGENIDVEDNQYWNKWNPGI